MLFRCDNHCRAAAYWYNSLHLLKVATPIYYGEKLCFQKMLWLINLPRKWARVLLYNNYAKINALLFYYAAFLFFPCLLLRATLFFSACLQFKI